MDKHAVIRVNKVSSGGVFGESDFFLGRTHSVRAFTLSHRMICWTLNRRTFAEMEVSHPSLCMLLQYTLLRSLSIASTCAMYALHPTTAYYASPSSNREREQEVLERVDNMV
jgi:CRP-like cAMP-binding protein